MKNKNKKEYNQISKKELLENDKILIMNKFGFTPIFKQNNTDNNKINKSTYSNKSLSSYKSQKNTKKNLTQSYSTSLLPRNNCRNYSQYKPTLTNASTNFNSNFFSSFYNSKNKLKLNTKERSINEQNIIHSCLWHKLIKNIDKNKINKKNNLEGGGVGVENLKNANNSSNLNNFNEFNKKNSIHNDIIKEKKIKRVKPEIKIPKANPVKIITNNILENNNSINSNNDENKNNNLNNNNKILDEFSESEREKNNIFIKSKDYLNDNNNNINININNTHNNINQKNEKFLCKFLSKNNIYDISSKDIKEEKSLMKYFYKEKESEFLFISEIEKKNKNIINLNPKKFIELNNNSIYNIISFQPEIYSELINTNKKIKKRINNCFNNIYKAIIDDFNFKYKNILQIVKYKFIQKKIKSLDNSNNYILDLILSCKIITQTIKQSIEISCNYFSNKNKYDYVWIFDVQKKSKIKRWISSEINSSFNFQKNSVISYTSQISSFSYLDEIQLQVNIFNIKNTINPTTLEWCSPLISSIEPEIYEKTKYINDINYDQLRACEIEMQILFWSCNLKEKQSLLIKEVKKIFEKFFLIKKVMYNSCKYDFYKIVMTPVKVGLIPKNKFCNFDINIIDKEKPIKNEIQCIYFINMNSFHKKMDINLGTELLFYLSDMKIK